MTVSVVLVPSIFALPPVEDGRDAAEDFVLNLLNWQRVSDLPWLSVCLPVGTVGSLADIDAFPAFPHLERLFASLGITEIMVRDVARAINTLLERLLPF